MTTESETTSKSIVLGIFPLGLALGGLLAAARALLAGFGHAPGLSEAAVSYRVLAIAERWPEMLAEALIAGVVCSLVLMFASEARPRRASTTAIAFLVTLLAAGAYLTGYPEPLPGIGVAAIGAAVGVTLIAFGLSRIPFTGVVPLVVGLGIGLGLPFAAASHVKNSQEGMPVRRILVDLVATRMAAEAGEKGMDFLEVVSQRPDAPVTTAVLTPIVDLHADTGDKPTLILPPPATVRFVVPADASGARFQAAVDIDLSSIDSLPGGPGGLESLPVTYRVRVDGQVAWETTFEHERVRPPWNVDHMQWRHVEVDGQRGVPVEPGQTVQLETELAGGLDPAAFTKEQLKLGFGGAFLVQDLRQPRRVPTPHAPNVIYVVVDTQRLDRLGCYGYPKDTTPHIDRFAEESIVFEDAYTTSSWTWPSTGSLLTSLPPDAHGVKSNASCTLAQSLTTIAEALQGRGYTTAAFVGNPIVSSTRYFDQGFETFDETRSEFRMSDELMPAALDWLETHAPLRFFLYLHLVDPHTPHRPSPTQMERLGLGPAPENWPEGGLDGIRRPSANDPGTEITPELVQYANDLYDTSVATTDMWFGRLLEKIDELGLDDRTIIVLTSDHGEELLDRGFRGHGHTVFPELVRSPLIFHVPGADPGRRMGVVSNRHVPTTIAALCDVALPGFDRPIDILNETLPDEALFETTKGEWSPQYPRNEQLFGLRSGSHTTQWRYSDLPVEEVPRSDLRYFDDRSDPAARSNVVTVSEAEARAAAERIREIVGSAREQKPTGIAGVGSGGTSTLQQIGYVGKDDDATEDPKPDEPKPEDPRPEEKKR
ncbi:Arylsulfatase [Planctomycetes bacterium Poly30]|uniref:Arylsulfatase n=1 Tax=Saltatorellus ferox TaxID=2528018 RepID=A0A518F176_9BACT|nr:Arylsulfatase [Planctomycetes bacterium Poly30]